MRLDQKAGYLLKKVMNLNRDPGAPKGPQGLISLKEGERPLCMKISDLPVSSLHIVASGPSAVPSGL